MKLYKYYKKDCSPCGTLAKILKLIEIPESIEFVEIDISLEENKKYIEEHKLKKVPTLIFEDGRRLDGVKKKSIVEEFIKGEQNAVSNQRAI